MAKVYLATNARTIAVDLELQEATSIVPLNAVVLQFSVPQAIDVWEIPCAPLSIALVPEAARLLAANILESANRLD